MDGKVSQAGDRGMNQPPLWKAEAALIVTRARLGKKQGPLRECIDNVLGIVQRNLARELTLAERLHEQLSNPTMILKEQVAMIDLYRRDVLHIQKNYTEYQHRRVRTGRAGPKACGHAESFLRHCEVDRHWLIQGLDDLRRPLGQAEDATLDKVSRAIKKLGETGR